MAQSEVSREEERKGENADGSKRDSIRFTELEPVHRSLPSASRWEGGVEINAMGSAQWQESSSPGYGIELGILINERFYVSRKRRLRLIYFQELGGVFRAGSGWWPREDRIEPGFGYALSNPGKKLSADFEFRARTRVFEENLNGSGNMLAYPRFLGPVILFGDLGFRYLPRERWSFQFAVAGIKLTYLHRAMWDDSLQLELPPPWDDGRSVVVDFGFSFRSEIEFPISKRFRLVNLLHVFCPVPDLTWTVQMNTDLTFSLSRSLGVTGRVRLQREELIDSQWRVLADLRCVWGW